MSVKLEDVKRLREVTGAGMMDCKKALAESEGDFEKAIEILRLKGQKVSAKRADREAKEGAVIAKVTADGKRGVIVKLSSETDFVSKHEEFVALTDKIAAHAVNSFPSDTSALLSESIDGVTVQDYLNELLTKFQEKIELTNYERLESDLVVPYVHMGNKAGVIVALNKNSDAAVDAGKDVAMQVAAMKPIALDKDGVDPSVVEKEIEIGKEQALQEGKPEAIVEKIAMGKLNKFYKENTLLNQIFVKDNKKSVKEYVASADSGLEVTAFKHVKLG